jgi:hypothetical protein
VNPLLNNEYIVIKIFKKIMIQTDIEKKNPSFHLHQTDIEKKTQAFIFINGAKGDSKYPF